MCWSCLAGLAKEVPKLHSKRRGDGEAVARALGLPTKAPSLTPLPIKSAILEPTLASSLEDEVLPRREAEAEAAALPGPQGQTRESGQELEAKPVEAEAAEVRPGGAHALCALQSRLSELQAQLDEERSRSQLLEARLLAATLQPTWADPALQASPRLGLAERIAKDREICSLQKQLAQEISRSAHLQSRLALCEPSPRRASFDLASPRKEMASTPLWQAPAGAQSPATSSTRVPTPSEAASSISSSPTPCFGGQLVRSPSCKSGVSILSGPAPPLSASPGSRSGPGHPGARMGWLEELSWQGMVTLVPADASACFTPRSAAYPGQPAAAAGELPLPCPAHRSATV